MFFASQVNLNQYQCLATALTDSLSMLLFVLVLHATLVPDQVLRVFRIVGRSRLQRTSRSVTALYIDIDGKNDHLQLQLFSLQY
jgi:hypothetical protein